MRLKRKEVPVVPVANMMAVRTRKAADEFNSYKFKRLNGSQVQVESKSGNKYTVSKLRESTICTCPDFMNRCVGTEVRCKHTIMTKWWETEVEVKNKILQEKSKRDEIIKRINTDFPDY